MTQNRNIVPINRINKFFSSEDFELEQMMSREFIEGDGNFTIILYKVDRNNTEFDSIYGEATKNGIRYLPPLEINVLPILEAPENKSYNKDGTGRYIQDGKLIFGVFDQHLNELKTSISYGDYIGYQVNETQIRYFSVVDDGSKNFDNKHTIFGYKSYYRTITCAPVDNNEFTAI